MRSHVPQPSEDTTVCSEVQNTFGTRCVPTDEIDQDKVEFYSVC